MITARVKDITNEYSGDMKKFQELGIKLGDEFEVDYISMGQSYTSIYLHDFTDYVFNSVSFNFYEDGEEIDIYSDPRFNPYM